MKKIILLSLFLGLLPGLAKAASEGDLSVAEMDATSMARIVKSSEAVAVRFTYAKTNPFSLSVASEAYVSILDTNMVFQAPNGTRDASIGSNGQFNLGLSTVDTVGEFCDAMNIGFALGQHLYQCWVEDAKRDDNTNLFANWLSTPTLSGGDLKANNGFEVLFDNAPGDATAGIPVVKFQSIGINPEKGKRVILHRCSSNSESGENLRVFGRLKKFSAGKDGAASADGLIRNDTTEVIGIPAGANATIVTNFSQTTGTGTLVGAIQASPPSIPDGAIEFDRDAHVVVRNNTASGANSIGGTVASSDVNFVDCAWTEQ